LWHGETSVALFAVVEELGHPEMVDLIRHGCLSRISIRIEWCTKEGFRKSGENQRPRTGVVEV